MVHVDAMWSHKVAGACFLTLCCPLYTATRGYSSVSITRERRLSPRNMEELCLVEDTKHLYARGMR
jgi:hypothetical protein